MQSLKASFQFVGQARIVKRLSSETQPRPPPPVKRPETPIVDVTLRVILTEPKLFQELNQYLNQIVDYATYSSSLHASHVGLDNEFLEMLPDLYEMVTVSMTVHIPCEGTRNKGNCKGAAQIAIKVTV